MSLEDVVQRALTEHAEEMSATPDVNALVARGTRARRRRRLTIFTAIAAAVVTGAVVGGPLLSTREERPSVVATPSPAPPVETSSGVAPRTGQGFFAGSANVPVTFTVPPGWEPLETMYVVKSGADPAFGVGFYDVANIYADGCRWVQVDPPVGLTVDDLVAAYQNQRDLRATPDRAVTVDEHSGRRLQFTVPNYRPDTCKDATYALAQADNAGTNSPQEGAPNFWAQAPGQKHDVWILDVDGTRLVIYANYPADASAQDRTDIETILRSVQIG